MSPPPPSADVGDPRADIYDKALGLETLSPGQNAFAQRKLEEHRHRLYQRKYSGGRDLPSNLIHPAFRAPSYSSTITTSIPPPPMPSSAPAEARDSNVTTMSFFVEAGKSPPLNLHTTPEHTPQPTQRGFIEERKEQQQHARSGSTSERTPVFRPTPVLRNEEFGSVKPSTSKKGQEVKFVDPPQSLPTKSPKKSLFGRFFGGAKGVVPPVPDGPIPPKAEQILGEKTPRRGLGRSPSKPKGLFSRRSSDADALVSPSKHDGPPRSQSSMGNHSHNSMSSRGSSLTKRVGSQAASSMGFSATPLITRTQSLKYMESGIPPTPPSKDTPPDEKAVKNAANLDTPIIPFYNNTPTKSTGFVSTDRNLSPTKIGSYGYRSGAHLVTKPSMHSMRASVVPNEMDPVVFEDAKSRVEGLGLEGFSMPYETRRQNHPTYSPSVYSPDWGRKSVATFPERIEERKEEEESPSMKMVGRHFMRESVDTTNTTCTSGTIHVGFDQSIREETPTYPELVKDSSIVDFMRYTSPTGTGHNVHDTPKLNLPGEATPRQGFMDGEIRSTAHLFAATPSQGYADSPMSHHSSAQVSPLHLHTATLETLPATTYKPPERKFSKKKHRKSQSLSAVDSVGSPAQKRVSHHVLEDRPMLPKESSPAWKEQRPIFNMDPQKLPSNMDLSKSIGPMGLSRSDEQMRPDFSKSIGSSAALSRSDEHMRPTKVPKCDVPEDSGVEVSDKDAPTDKKKKRISTLHAHEFYRHSPEPSTGRNSEASTIIQTPKLPPGMIATRNADGLYTSSGLVDTSVPPVPQNSPAAVANSGNEGPTMEELMALIQQQQSTIQQMMLKMQHMSKK